MATWPPRRPRLVVAVDTLVSNHKKGEAPVDDVTGYLWLAMYRAAKDNYDNAKATIAPDARQQRELLANRRESLAELDAELAAGKMDANEHAVQKDQLCYFPADGVTKCESWKDEKEFKPKPQQSHLRLPFARHRDGTAEVRALDIYNDLVTMCCEKPIDRKIIELQCEDIDAGGDGLTDTQVAAILHVSQQYIGKRIKAIRDKFEVIRPRINWNTGKSKRRGRANLLEFLSA